MTSFNINDYKANCLLADARIVCRIAHQAIGQERKYTSEPYYNHPERVSALVKSFEGSLHQQAVALVHDVLEDTQVGRSDLIHILGTAITLDVEYLTNVYEKHRYPDWNRNQRFTAELKRLATIPVAVKSAKVCDILDNITGIVEQNPEFARVYLKEKAFVLEAMKDCDLPQAFKAAIHQLGIEEAKLATLDAGGFWEK
jgi:(p)ppGpp synthase/HD superfamily hydrolase